MNRLNVEPVRAQWDELVAEFRRDPNKDHFKRTAAFDADFQHGAVAAPAVHRLSRQLGDRGILGVHPVRRDQEAREEPRRARAVRVMSRDEGRHAGFINHTLKDFDVAVDLSFLTRAKKYTYFQPKFIYYATYLCEKIGYARYITIFRHFEKHPEMRFHPIFTCFENWCQDEFRHGEAFAMLMRANPEILRGATPCGSGSSCSPYSRRCTCGTICGTSSSRRWASTSTTTIAA